MQDVRSRENITQSTVLYDVYGKAPIINIIAELSWLLSLLVMQLIKLSNNEDKSVSVSRLFKKEKLDSTAKVFTSKCTTAQHPLNVIKCLFYQIMSFPIHIIGCFH